MSKVKVVLENVVSGESASFFVPQFEVDYLISVFQGTSVRVLDTGIKKHNIYILDLSVSCFSVIEYIGTYDQLVNELIDLYHSSGDFNKYFTSLIQLRDYCRKNSIVLSGCDYNS